MRRRADSQTTISCGWLPFQWHNSVAEEEEQILSASLRPLEQLLLRARALDDVRLQADPSRELVLDDEIGLTLIPNALLHLHIEVLSELLAHGHLRAARF